MKRSSMVFLDNLFLPAFWLGKQLKALAPSKKSEEDQTLILKFFGVGSITRITSVLKDDDSDHSYTFLTLKRNQSTIELMGQEAIYINDSNVFVLFGSLFARIFSVWKMKSTRVVDMERSSNIAGYYSIILSIRKRYSRFHLKEENLKKGGINSVSLHNKPAIDAIAEILEIAPKGVEDEELSPVEVKNIVVNINAGGYLPERKYPMERWVELVRELDERFPESTYSFSGLKNEMDHVVSFSEALSSFIPDSRRCIQAGKQNLEEFIESLRQCDLFLTNDSGPLHLAHFYGVRTVTIWGPTSSYLVGYSDSNRMLNLNQERSCSPCFVGPKSDVAKACNGKLSCFQEMETTKMVEQIEAFVS
ncbi:MAG: glycosyltransferase family 9 protein [Crocinitomicaceae bacterium]